MESLGGSSRQHHRREAIPAPSPPPRPHESPPRRPTSPSHHHVVPIATGLRASLGAALPGQQHLLVEVLPSPKAEPTFALSAAASREQHGSPSRSHDELQRPRSAPAQPGASSPPRLRPVSASPASPSVQHGRLNLYESQHIGELVLLVLQGQERPSVSACGREGSMSGTRHDAASRFKHGASPQCLVQRSCATGSAPWRPPTAPPTNSCGAATGGI